MFFNINIYVTLKCSLIHLHTRFVPIDALGHGAFLQLKLGETQRENTLDRLPVHIVHYLSYEMNESGPVICPRGPPCLRPVCAGIESGSE